MTTQQLSELVERRDPIDPALLPGVLDRLASAINALRDDFERYRIAQAVLGRDWDSHLDYRLQQCEQTLALRAEIPAAPPRSPRPADYDQAMADAPW